MIERVRGRAGERGEDWIVLDLGAVCLRINTTAGTLSNLDADGAEISLYTYLYLREDVMVLYGFGSREERAVFERLLGVTGVGPRVAQAMLSALSPTALQGAIEAENVDALIRVPGVGRKTAQRVILELKGKLVPVGAPSTAAPAPAHAELIGVMMGLGYSAAEAAEALRNVPAEEGLTDEDRLRSALRYFSAP